MQSLTRVCKCHMQIPPSPHPPSPPPLHRVPVIIMRLCAALLQPCTPDEPLRTLRKTTLPKKVRPFLPSLVRSSCTRVHLANGPVKTIKGRELSLSLISLAHAHSPIIGRGQAVTSGVRVPCLFGLSIFLVFLNTCRLLGPTWFVV